MESQAGRCGGDGRDRNSNATGGDRGGSSSAGLGLRIARPAGHHIESADSLEGLHSPSIQDILVALPADFDPLQPQQAPEGPADATLQLGNQFGGAWRLTKPYSLSDHRQRSVSVHFQADYSQPAPSVDQVLQHRQQLTSATATLREQLHQNRSDFKPDRWSQRDQTPTPAAERSYHHARLTQRNDTEQRQQHQKRRRMSESAKTSASHRQRGKKRLTVMDEEKTYPEVSRSPSPSSAASDEDDDGSPLARALSATRSQIDEMATAPSNAVSHDIEVHSKRKRPGKQAHKRSIVALETSNRELPRSSLHTGSSGGSAVAQTAQTTVEDKPVVPLPIQPSTPSEPQRAAIVTASGRPGHQATCRVSWCSQPGKRFGLCWIHGGVKRCCESNCSRVALETSEFCSFHQTKHSHISRTASI